MKDQSRYHIRVLERALRILYLMTDGRARTLRELSVEVGLSDSTVFRLLTTLTSYGYLQRIEQNGRYSLGLASLELARAYQDGDDLRKMALSELEALRDDVKETVHLAILDDVEVVYLEKLPGLHAIGLMGSRVGGRSPAHCTGVGKILLAHQGPEVVQRYIEKKGLKKYTKTTLTSEDEFLNHLEMVRKKGYALDNGEHEEEVRCVAAPLFDMNGDVVAAISISGPAARMDPIASNQYLIEKAKAASIAISAKLGYRFKSLFPAYGKEDQNAKSN
ncbi:MAG: IclR family transcriptional regulator [Anaerolineales bacterium]|nr:IclR family transcriptional regulator [Anaerolineales bacterium]